MKIKYIAITVLLGFSFLIQAYAAPTDSKMLISSQQLKSFGPVFDIIKTNHHLVILTNENNGIVLRNLDANLKVVNKIIINPKSEVRWFQYALDDSGNYLATTTLLEFGYKLYVYNTLDGNNIGINLDISRTDDISTLKFVDATHVLVVSYHFPNVEMRIYDLRTKKYINFAGLDKINAFLKTAPQNYYRKIANIFIDPQTKYWIIKFTDTYESQILTQQIGIFDPTKNDFVKIFPTEEYVKTYNTKITYSPDKKYLVSLENDSDFYFYNFSGINDLVAKRYNLENNKITSMQLISEFWTLGSKDNFYLLKDNGIYTSPNQEF